MDGDEQNKTKNENETLRQLCQNRKKQNFSLLKTWDQNRAHYLITHRKVADQISEALQVRMTESKQFLEVMIQFLKDCENQQKKYENESMTNPESKLKANAISKNIHMTTSKCLQRLYSSTQNFKSFRKVKMSLEEGVNIIEQLLSQSEKETMEIRTKIQLQVVEIQNKNAETSASCDRVVQFYKGDRNKVFNSEQDLFYLQQSFIHQASLQTEAQRSLGEMTVELLNSLEQSQKKKLEAVKSILQKYLSSLSEARSHDESVKSLLDILQKQTESKYIQMIYSSEELLSKEIIRDVRKVEKKLESEKIDIKEIRRFLLELECPSFDCRQLILKEYRIYLKVVEEDLENCMLMVTVDGFLHIYQFREDLEIEEAHPDYSVSLLSNIQMKREGDMRLSLQAKKAEIFNFRNSSVMAISFLFMNEDQRQEFLEFVNLIIMK